jgi:hypothetical protein
MLALLPDPGRPSAGERVEIAQRARRMNAAWSAGRVGANRVPWTIEEFQRLSDTRLRLLLHDEYGWKEARRQGVSTRSAQPAYGGALVDVFFEALASCERCHAQSTAEIGRGGPYVLGMQIKRPTGSSECIHEGCGGHLRFSTNAKRAA